MKTNRVMKTYRFNQEVIKDLKEILKTMNTNETSFIEMAIIEKMCRIKEKQERNDKLTVQDENVAKNG